MDSSSIQSVVVEHQFPKRDLPVMLQRLEEWLAVLLTLGLFFVVGFYRDHVLWVFAVFVGLVVVVRAWKWLITWQTQRTSAGNGLAETNSESASRLTCYGEPIELRPLRELRAEALEPIVARRRPTRRRTLLNAPVAEALSLWELGGLVVILGLLLLGWRTWVILVLVGVASLIKMVISQWLAESYQVADGQLEVIRRRERSDVTRPRRVVPLADARVVCRYHTQRLSITPAGEGAKPMEIDLSSLRRPHAFAQAVFQSALGAAPASNQTAN